MDKLIAITSLEAFKEAIKNQSIIMFSADWCPDCIFAKTFMNDIVDENKDFTWYYVDRDQMIDLCIDLNILGIPSFIAYRDGKEVARYVDKLRKTREQVQKFVNEVRGE